MNVERLEIPAIQLFPQWHGYTWGEVSHCRDEAKFGLLLLILLFFLAVLASLYVVQNYSFFQKGSEWIAPFESQSTVNAILPADVRTLNYFGQDEVSRRNSIDGLFYLTIRLQQYITFKNFFWISCLTSLSVT